MRGINKVILIGHLGADPETRAFNNGGNVTRINIATSEQWIDKQTGEKKEHTEWHRVSLFNRLGEIAAQYLRKGSAVYIEGTLRTNRYTDQNGIERFSTEIRADNMQMLGSNPNNTYQSNYNQNGQWGNQNIHQNQPPYSANSNFNQQSSVNQGYNPQNFSDIQNQIQQQNPHLNQQNVNSQNPMANNSFVNQPPTPTPNNGFNPPQAGAVDDDIPF